MSMEMQMRIINGYLRNRGMAGAKLTLIARVPDAPGKWIVKGDDTLEGIQEVLSKAFPNHPPGAGKAGT